MSWFDPSTFQGTANKRFCDNFQEGQLCAYLNQTLNEFSFQVIVNELYLSVSCMHLWILKDILVKVAKVLDRVLVDQPWEDFEVEHIEVEVFPIWKVLLDQVVYSTV